MEYQFYFVRLQCYRGNGVWEPDYDRAVTLNQLAAVGWRVYGPPAYIPLPAPGGALIYTLQREVPSETRTTA